MHNRLAPSVTIASPSEFFDHLLESSAGGTTLPTWRGELYLEFHRGTYTTQAAVKRGNRTMERLLMSLEYFATLASISTQDYTYPRDEIRKIWHATMLNQFHDVLPGTSVSLVVEDVMEIHAQRSHQARQLIEDSLVALYPHSRKASLSERSASGTIVVLDPLRLSREELVELGGKPHWLTTDSTGIGSVTPPHEPLRPARAYALGDGYILENDDLRLTLAKGRIASLVDLHLDRELILPGPGAETGGLTLYEDYPLEWDAWDMEIYHLQSYKHVEFQDIQTRVLKHGAELVAKAVFGESQAILTFALDATIPVSSIRSMLRVDAHIDWHAEHQVLKFVLPLDIHAATATFGTQFGTIQRPTHRNTTYDQARFEVCGHMFADLSETGYGLAIVSEQYGYSVEENVMRLSLLRASTSPDPKADRGVHHIPFAIMPHSGSLQESNVYRRAMAFLNPVHLRSIECLPRHIPSFVIRGEQAQTVILETIKMAEDVHAVVLRVYESLGRRSRGEIIISHVDVHSAHWTNFLEEPIEQASLEHREDALVVPISLRTFEIKTLLLSLTPGLDQDWQSISPMIQPTESVGT